MTNDQVQICIVGGGFGGLYTALYLGNFSWVKSGKCQITLIEPKDRFLFTPLLYELITGELKRWEIAPSYDKLLRNKKINFCQQKVRGVDLQSRQIDLSDGQRLAYDYLVIAVGNQTRYAEIPGVREHTLKFRTLEDAELLNERLKLLEASGREWIRIAVIGGGPSGVELACKLADRLGKRGQVRLVERGGEILKPYDRAIQKAAMGALKSRRVVVDLSTSVKAIEAEEITLEGNKTSRFPVDLVLWTAGTETREWVRQLDCQHNQRGQILTHPTLQLLDYPKVFALGDLAQIEGGSQNVPTTAQAAYQQASRAAKNLKAILQGKRLGRFRYLHLGEMMTVGKGAAIVYSFSIMIKGALGALSRRLIYVGRLPTLSHRLQVLKQMLVNAYRTVLRACRRQLGKLF